MEWGDLSAGEQAEVAGMNPAEFSEWRGKRTAAASRPQEEAHLATDSNRGNGKRSVTDARVIALFGIGSLLLFGLGVGLTDKHLHSLSTGDVVGALLVIAAVPCFVAFIVLLVRKRE